MPIALGRYLSGLLLAIGLAFWGTVPRIEAQGVRFRLLTLLVFTGGLARLAGVFLIGLASPAMLFGLAMELFITPCLAFWRERLDRLCRGRRIGYECSARVRLSAARMVAPVACSQDSGYNRQSGWRRSTAMDMTGEERIAASREAVWAALNDVAVLKQCIPGCELLEKTSDTDMAARVKLQVGPVRAAFTGKVTLSDIDPPNGYRISGEGQGGVAGYAKGGAVVRLVDDGAGTLLKYEAKADVGGKLAQLGGRLIEFDGQEARRRIFPEVRRHRRGRTGRRASPALPEEGWFRRLWRRLFRT